MKNTIKVLGLIARTFGTMVAVIGLFIACGDDGGNGNPCSGGHDYSVFVSTTANCTTAGQDTYKCNVCTSTEQRARAALGHTGNWLITTYPTELADGEETIDCTTCLETDTRPLTKATYQTYFYGTFILTDGYWQPYTITITASNFNYSHSYQNEIIYVNLANITWTAATNTATSQINSVPVSTTYPNGFTINGTRTFNYSSYTQMFLEGTFIALSADTNTLYMATSASSYKIPYGSMGDSIFTRVQE